MVHDQSQYLTYGALEQYMHLVHWTPRLAEGEQEQLLSRLEHEEHTQSARTRLVEGYQSLILALAKRYVRHCKRMELMDLVQEGNLGLLQAIDRYDCGERSASFTTWVFACVRGAMQVACCRYEGAFHMPVEKAKAIKRVGYVSEHLCSQLGREPTIVEIAQEMRIGEGDVRELIVLGGEVYSLYVPIDEDGETLLADVVEDPTAVARVEEVDDELSSADDVLAHLTVCEQVVLKLRYGVEAYTQREVAELLGVALSTVAMVDRSAKRRLRKALEAVA